MRVLSDKHEIHLVSETTGDETNEQRAWAEKYCVDVLNVRQAVQNHRFSLAAFCQTAAASTFRTTAIEQLRRCQPDILHLEGPMVAPFAEI